MTFGQSISVCYSKYATFSGRAQRSEFWFFYLFTILLTYGTLFLGLMLGDDGGIIYLITSLSVLLPVLAVQARRLHDTGRSGWWYLLSITIIGIIPLIIWWCSEGTKEANKFGDPIDLTTR